MASKFQNHFLSILFSLIAVFILSCGNVEKERANTARSEIKDNSIYKLGLLTIDSVDIPKLNVTVYITSECKECFSTYFIKYKNKLYKDKNDYSETYKIKDLNALVIEQALSGHYNLNIVGFNSFIRDYEVNEKRNLTLDDLSPIIEIYFPQFKKLTLKNANDLAIFRNKGLDVSFQNKDVQRYYGSKLNFQKKFDIFTNYLNSRIGKENCLFYYLDNQIYLFEKITHENKEYSFISMKAFL